MKHRKGEAIQRFQVQNLIPLYAEDVELKDLVLPQFKADDPLGSRCARGVPPTVESVVRKLLSRRSMTCDVIVSCIHLVFQGDHLKFVKGGSTSCELHVDDGRSCKEGSDDDTRDDEEGSVEVRAAWGAVKDRLDLDEWKKLVRNVASRIVFVEAPHPLHHYATHTLPNLPGNERQIALQTLRRLLSDGAKRSTMTSSSSSSSILSVMKQCQDRFSIPRRYGALLRDNDDMQSTFPHSCIPTAWLELALHSSSNGPPTIQVTALFDVPDGEQASVCYVGCDDDVEQREANAAMRTGGACACACLRCRYEASRFVPLGSHDRRTLARYYLSKGQLETARQLYQASLDDTPDQPDAWHALGAIQLSQGRFLVAQRTWREASDRFPDSCQLHAGMALQVEKATCYRYFDSPSLEMSSTIPRSYSSRTPLPNVQVAQMLAPSACKQILEWASHGEWSQQRHYAVPTNDVPVHTIAPVLEWFNRWFFEEMRPHLARQFESSSDFFVHDAFCVQYVAGKVSNHLPIHTDESTHSFVIALNDCDEYEGGGTYFPKNDAVLRLKAGEVLSFRGDSVPHGGETVTKNARHILVAFLYHGDDGVINKSEAGRKRRLNFGMDQRKEEKPGFTFQFAL
jgi:tetratricopeptide (TPR) repeat protein